MKHYRDNNKTLLTKGEGHEKEKQNESFKGNLEKKKCQKFPPKVKGGKKVSFLNKRRSV